MGASFDLQYDSVARVHLRQLIIVASVMHLFVVFLLCLVTLWMRPIGTDVSSSMVFLCVRVGLTAYIVQKTRLSIS